MAAQINANLDDLASLKRVTTLDGRTITINSFTVEPGPEVSGVTAALATAVKGDCFITYGGETLVFEGLKPQSRPYVRFPLYPYFLKDKKWGISRSYTESGALSHFAPLLHPGNIKEKVEQSSVDLSKAVAGDVFVDFSGQEFEFVGRSGHGDPEYPFELRDSSGGMHFAKDGVFLRGSSGLKERNLKQFVRHQIPRVDISAVKVGDRLKLRDDRLLEVLELDELSPESDYAYTTDGWFRKDGTLDFGDGRQDVVEVVPAPKKSLLERIAERIKAVGADQVSEVVISTEDWREAFRAGPVGSVVSGPNIGGVVVLHSGGLLRGSYRLQFISED